MASDIGLKKWGRKLYLVTGSEMDKLKRIESKPYYLNKNSADIKSQLEDEKISAKQTKEINDKETNKRELTNFLKPVLSDALSNQTILDKEKIKQILLIIDNLKTVDISNNDITIKGKKFDLNEVVKDLLSNEKQNFDYDVKQLLDVFIEADVNPRLIPNKYLRHRLMVGEKKEGTGGEEGRQNRGDESTEETSESEGEATPKPVEKKPEITHLKIPAPPSSSQSTPTERTPASARSTAPDRLTAENRSGRATFRESGNNASRQSESHSAQRRSSRDKKPVGKYGKGFGKRWTQF